MPTPDPQPSTQAPGREGPCNACRALLERVSDTVDLALDLDTIEATALLAELRDELIEALAP